MGCYPRSRSLGHYFDLPPGWRWIVWPFAIALSAGIVISLLLSGEVITLAGCASLASLPVLAAIIFWFNHLVFKATKPCREDLLPETALRDNPS